MNKSAKSMMDQIITLQPLYWKDYCDARRDGRIIKSVRDFQLADINKFYARYRLARRFEYIGVTGYSAKTIRGYSEAFRLMLFLSAGERLGKVSGGTPSSWIHKDENLSDKYRRIIFSKQTIRSDFVDFGGNKKNAIKFLDGSNHNVMIAAVAIRNMFAHGTFTPHGASSISNTAASTLYSTSQIIDNFCVTNFNDWALRVTKK